ncbi:unnamed protein product [Blepharisma stoltei]|uniref:BZIP domain-containing protein n=1 Tax=Blepharisma stoltei TaxID=1481888 RepID=A0AAU9J9G7_9CILI|nr:unnamed protein product [Blepharisma stoltei]
MEDFDTKGFQYCMSESSSFYEEKVSTTVSPLENEDLNMDWLHADTDLGLDLELTENFFSSDFSSKSSLDYIPADSTPTALCSICQKNIVKLEDPSQIRKKRKRNDNAPVLSSMTVCEECRNLNVEDLKNYKNASDKSKRVIKREHAKRRANESEAVRKLKEEQEMLAENKDMPENERRKLQQMIRNRISAQQSRDRKKAFVSQLEEENKLLAEQNNSLKYRLKQIQAENTYLKNQLVQIHMGKDEQPYFSKVAKGATLALATVISVMMVVNTIQADQNSTTLPPARRLIENFDLNEYKNNEGVSLAQTAHKTLEEIGINLEQFLPAEKNEPKFSNNLLEIRKNRIDKTHTTPHLRALAGPNDPCMKAMTQEIQKGAMTSVFCPSVQAYWDDVQTQPNLNYLQLMMPLESMPSLAPASLDPSRKYLLEMVCKVSDVNVFPIS